MAMYSGGVGSNSAGSSMQPPTLYACASRVKMPHVGADESVVKIRKPYQLQRPLIKTKKLPEEVTGNYLKTVSQGMSFSEDVVKDRCFHMLPYSDRYFHDALDISDIVPRPPKSRAPIGRHDTRGTDRRHMPCHVKKLSSHKLKPLKRKILQRAAEMQQQGAPSASQEKSPTSSTEELPQSDFFLTQPSHTNRPSSELKAKTADPEPDLLPKEKNGWDEFMMSRLSQQTAEWIIRQRTSPGEKRDKLQKYFVEYYGPLKEDDPELVKDNVSEIDFDAKQDVAKSAWRKGDETLLDKVREKTRHQEKDSIPYSDDTRAAFYRLPAGFRRAKKYQDKEQEGAINTTAHKIEVKPYVPPPPPTLKDFINPAVGDKVYNTSNMFEQEWLTGSQQVHQKFDESNKIIMDSQNKYRKQMQKEYPQVPTQWFPLTSREKEAKEADKTKVKQFERGLQRWSQLPQPIDDTAETLKLQAPDGSQTLTKSPDPAAKKEARSNNVLIQIVNDWRSKWHLDMRYADASPDDLIRDMADLHPHIRLKAITTCARAAEYRPPQEMGIQLDPLAAKVNQVKLLPDRLFIALECLLDDSHVQVKQAAAIAMYSLERPTEKAEEILRWTLSDESSVDRWTAAQCLAYYGECDSEVVGELIGQLLSTEDKIRYEQAAFLLARLSDNSTLVHSMLGEQLNSSGWRHRVMACKVLPKLHGHINRDLVHKLTYLMWTDWHSEVRTAAAHTLGKTGHGKDVHDELKEKIVTGKERQRTEAVSRVGQLGIMTAKLLPSFLQCFHDSYVSVRMETCIACSNLRISDEQVLEKLVHLATFDPIWKVKALALQALGTVGVVTKPISDCALWAFRYEDQEGVRAEACHTLRVLNIQDKEVAQTLQDRYLVETSTLVKQEIIRGMAMFDISLTEDMDMVAQIKNEVRKLCSKSNIAAQITYNEMEEDMRMNKERMIHRPPGSPKPGDGRPKVYRAQTTTSRPASTAPSRTSQPQIVVTINSSLGRPYSREMSVTTPNADKEVQDILNKYEESSCTATESRPESSQSRRTIHTIMESPCEEEDDTVTKETSGQATASTSGDQTVVEEPSPTKRPVHLGDALVYTEITADPAQSTHSHDVLLVQHHTPGTTPCPANTTPCPTDTTPCPTDTTPCPADTTPCPADTTPCPADTTPCPVDTAAGEVQLDDEVHSGKEPSGAGPADSEPEDVAQSEVVESGEGGSVREMSTQSDPLPEGEELPSMTEIDGDIEVQGVGTGVQSEDTVVQRDDTHVQTEDTQVQTEETLVQSDDPVVQSDDPVVQSEDTMVQAENIGVQSEDTMVQSEDKVVQDGAVQDRLESAENGAAQDRCESAETSTTSSVSVQAD